MTAWAIIQFGLAILSPSLDPKPKPKPPPAPNIALASWYAEHGTGACGVGDVQSGYRFASLFLRCGTPSGSATAGASPRRCRISVPTSADDCST